MTILVVGNGFDKALGLPTDYSDFLKFSSFMKPFTYDNNRDVLINPKDFDIDRRIVGIINQQCGNIRYNLFSRINEIRPLCHRNYWLDFFIKKKESFKKQGKERY